MHSAIKYVSGIWTRIVSWLFTPVCACNDGSRRGNAPQEVEMVTKYTLRFWQGINAGLT